MSFAKNLWYRLTGRARREEIRDFVDKLLSAKTANEMTSLIGLRPINAKGQRSFYLIEDSMKELVESKFTDRGSANIYVNRIGPAESFSAEYVYPDGHVRTINSGLSSLSEARNATLRFLEGLSNLNG